MRANIRANRDVLGVWLGVSACFAFFTCILGSIASETADLLADTVLVVFASCCGVAALASLGAALLVADSCRPSRRQRSSAS